MAGLLPLRPGFDPRPFYVESIVEDAALPRVFSRSLDSPPMLYKNYFISLRRYTTLAIACVVK